MVLQHLILKLGEMTIKYKKIYLTPFLKLKRKICQLEKENVVLGSSTKASECKKEGEFLSPTNTAWEQISGPHVLWWG